MWFKKQNCDVICIGSASKDIFFPTDEAVLIDTPEDITSKQKIAFELGGKYRVADRFEAVGGVAANVSQGLARMGFRVGCYSNVGNDEIGRWIERVLEKEKVLSEFLSFDETARTDLSAIIVMTQNGERTIFHNRDANEKLLIRKELIVSTDWLFVSALNGAWVQNMETLLEVKRNKNFRLALNPGQHNIKENTSALLPVIKETDVLLLNKDEAIELLMHTDIVSSETQLNDELFLLESLHSLGAKVIGMTDGKRGGWGFDGSEYWFCPIHTRSGVLDTTGAGDAFGSGFIAAHLKGLALSDSLSYGMANSGSVVGFYGASEGLLSDAEMKEQRKNIVPKKLKDVAR